MRLIEKNIRARDIVTRKSLENAARVVACTGGSTNAALHLPAIAHEAGIDFDLFDVTDIMRDTPYFVRPAARREICGQGPVRGGRRARGDEGTGKAGLLHEDCITASGKTLGEEPGRDPGRGGWPGDLSRRHAPITKTGGVVGLKGNLAPDGAIVKVAGMTAAEQVFTGPARVFECEEEAFAAVKARAYKEGEVIVIRNEGPAAGRGCARCWPRPPPCRARAWARRWR
jgi:dihydroxy-acid dehydratase